MKRPLTLLALLLPLPLGAAPPLTVTCGKLLDPTAKSVRTNVTVSFDKDAVVAAAPKGAAMLDLSAYTCLPGLIDAHTHLLLQGDPTNVEYDEQVLVESNPYRALRAAAAARFALAHGFTTVRDLGTEGAGFTDVDLKKAFDKGILEGPRVYASGPAMGTTGSYPLLGYSWERKMPDGVLKCDGADDCRKAVRYQVQYGVDWIKVYADHGYYHPGGEKSAWASIPNFTPEELHAIVDEAHRLRKKVAAHSMTPTGHKSALDAGVDTIEHGDVLDAWDVKTMAERKVFYCPTITALESVKGPRGKTSPIWNELWERAEKSFRMAREAGVPVAFGTDAGAFEWDKRNAAEEFGFMEAWGMPAWDALRSATVVAAELLDAKGRLGCLDERCAADLVAVAGDPLADPKVLLDMKAVVSRGRVVKAPR